MSKVTKAGLRVHCDTCALIDAERGASETIDVRAPVTDLETGETYDAELSIRFENDSETIVPLRLSKDGRDVAAGPELSDRIGDLLRFVQVKRLCGALPDCPDGVKVERARRI